MKVYKEQRNIFADFCVNFAVAWFAAGIISPFVAGKSLGEVGQIVLISLCWGGASLYGAFKLAKGGR